MEWLIGAVKKVFDTFPILRTISGLISSGLIVVIILTLLVDIFFDVIDRVQNFIHIFIDFIILIILIYLLIKQVKILRSLNFTRSLGNNQS